MASIIFNIYQPTNIFYLHKIGWFKFIVEYIMNE